MDRGEWDLIFGFWSFLVTISSSFSFDKSLRVCVFEYVNKVTKLAVYIPYDLQGGRGKEGNVHLL